MKRRPPIVVRERKLAREKADGLYWPETRAIEIDPRQPPKEYLDSVVHEVLHDALPSFSERRINSVSRLISRVLWNQSYRKVSGV